MEIKVENLTKNYRKRTVIDHISCILKPQKYGLIGPNGSGKTTFIRCLLQIINYKGTITFGEEKQNKQLQIGYLPQTFSAFKELSVYEQLEYFLVLKNMTQNKNDEIDRVLKIVNLEDYKHQKTNSLSGGMMRRLGIAQALLGQPDILIFDEPTVGLDPDERLRFREIINNIQLDIPVILSTHIIEDVSHVCDQIIFLKNGQIKYIGDIHILLEKANGHIYECPIEKFDIIKEKILKLEIKEHQLRIFSSSNLNYPFLTTVKPTMEDIYQTINQSNETIF